MAEQNACASLVENGKYQEAEAEYERLLLKGENPLQIMLNMQAGLQTELAKKHDHITDPAEFKTMGEIYDWSYACNGFVDDERREFYTSLGGMSNGEKNASAVWKIWKKDHIDYRNKPLDELSESDRLEILFELIDELHFIMMKYIPFGMSAKDIFILYYLKNAENFERQQRGY